MAVAAGLPIGNQALMAGAGLAQAAMQPNITGALGMQAMQPALVAGQMYGPFGPAAQGALAAQAQAVFGPGSPSSQALTAGSGDLSGIGQIIASAEGQQLQATQSMSPWIIAGVIIAGIALVAKK